MGGSMEQPGVKNRGGVPRGPRVSVETRRRPYKESRCIDGHFIPLYRLRAEQALGKPLPPGAEVHHVDPTNRDTSPLVICQDDAYHKLLHNRLKVYRAGGDPNTEKVCSACKRPKPFGDFYVQRLGYAGRGSFCKPCATVKHEQWVASHRELINARQRAYQQRRRRRVVPVA